MPETGFRWLRTGKVEDEDEVLKLRLLKCGVDFLILKDLLTAKGRPISMDLFISIN